MSTNCTTENEPDLSNTNLTQQQQGQLKELYSHFEKAKWSDENVATPNQANTRLEAIQFTCICEGHRQ